MNTDNKCTRCGSANRPEARYCKHCGNALAVTSKQSILDSVKGLVRVKDCLSDIYDKAVAIKNRAEATKVKMRLEMNFFITGAPGTGKSMLANTIARLLADAGVTSQRPPVTVDAADYEQWAKEIDKNTDAIKDGVLIIENIGKLTGRQYGAGVSPLDPLFSRLSRWYGNPDSPVVILTGLTDMADFMRSNTNVGRYFPFVFHLEPYTIAEMADICEAVLLSRFGLTLETEAREKLERVFTDARRDSKSTADNGHLAARKASEISVEHTAYPGDDTTVGPDEVPGKEFIAKTFEQVIAEFDNYVGIDEIKETVRTIAARVDQRRRAIEAGTADPRTPLIDSHYQFLGNPGTGKTTVARIFADALKSLGALPVGQLVEVSRDNLVSKYVGETPQLVKAAVERAIGGVLFIDEAYRLCRDKSDTFGLEAIESLLTYTENRRGEFVLIMAGYTKEMGELAAVNDGIASRINNKVYFRDYKPEELTEIFRRMLASTPERFTVDPETDARLINVFTRMYQTRTSQFGNAREVRNVLTTAISRHAARLSAQGKAGAEDTVLTLDDIDAGATSAPTTADEILAPLDGLIGMDSVRSQLRALANKMIKDRRRAAARPGSTEIPTVHIALTGNPGTGKTEVAKRLGRVFKAMGILPTDKVVFRERKTLLDSYSNSAAVNMDKAVDEALGGVLFIDEAYNLMPLDPGGRDNIGAQAVEALMTRMVNDAGKFITVIAGYKNLIEEFVNNANPGLKSRFTTYIDIPDYNAEQLFEIYMQQAERRGYTLTPGAVERLKLKIDEMITSKDERFANARDIIALFNQTCLRQDSRVDVDAPVDQLYLITEDDIPYTPPRKIDLADCLGRLDDLIGLDSVKKSLRDLADSITIEQQRAAIEGRRPQYVYDHYLFVGNPGTGKTTVARIMGEIMHSLGLLPSNKVIETVPKDFIAGYVGHTAKQTEITVNRALGGILFIDEAYGLNDGPGGFGKDAMPTLLTKLLDYKGRMICIAAGYPREIRQWVDTNSGLRSRFTKEIVFEDYDADQLARIFLSLAAKAKFTLTPEADEAMRSYFRTLVYNKTRDFANAREARNYFDAVKLRQGARLRRVMEMPSFDRAAYFVLEREDMLV